MSFGICWELSDMSAMAGSLQAASLPTALRNEARRYLNGGLGAWDTSPAGQFDTAICPLCHIVACTYGTLPAFIQLLRDIAAHFQSQGTATEATRYLLSLADDLSAPPGIGQNSSGREPYP